jgi:hypothetical protein
VSTTRIVDKSIAIDISLLNSKKLEKILQFFW